MKKAFFGLSIVFSSFSFSATTADLATECQDYFKETDSLLDNILAAAKDEGIDSETAKKQYQAYKNQFSTLSVDKQKSACSQAKEELMKIRRVHASRVAK